MLNISEALQHHLDSGATTLCHCWRIRRVDGEVIGLTDHDRPLIFDQTEFLPQSGATGSAMISTADLAVDNSEIEGVLNSELLRARDLASGRFDEARVEIWRVNWESPQERVLLKIGVIGEVVRTHAGFRAELRGLSHLLDQTTGRVYQRQCDAVVGDTRCGVNLNDPTLKTSGAVSEVVDQSAFLISSLDGFESEWFAHGILTWESGENQHQTAFIKTHGVGSGHHSIALWQPAPLEIAVGDSFTVTAGCDRRFETCINKFSNVINFRGFHLMPGNDFVISYPRREDDNNGGRR